MGSFKGHVLPGSMFLLVGLWHLLNSITNYVVNPKAFRARAWHPARCFAGKARYLEVYVLLVGTFTDMCIEFFYSTHLKFTVNGAINTNHLNDFEHAAMLLMFFLFCVTVLVHETTRYFTPIPLNLNDISLGSVEFLALDLPSSFLTILQRNLSA